MLPQAGKLLQSGTVSAVAKRAYSPFLVSSLPRVRVSLPEKVVHGLIIGAGILATPAIVLSNAKHYKQPKE
ncbi:unnamed protein product [Notodromas monacha]|uniref:Uncharacterized protein n=1 Tax=Notodromas monacha TaxID=399045 RepID=A0A7R9BKI4_9CRUS|nr:unnamed protein product [Notodromas monacha]CAG0915821.1 unnamed protein product [Notodromas monacha]